MKKIHLEAAWKLPMSYATLIEHPPAGYDFIQQASAQEAAFKAASRLHVSYRLLAFVDRFLPTVLLKSWLQRKRALPVGTDLTYSHGHLILSPEPWVVEVEYAHLLLGLHPKHLRRFQGLLESTLSRPNCRKIICWSEAGRRTMLSGLRSEPFRHKIELCRPAVPAKPFRKEYRAGPVKLLFVGSGNIKGEAEGRGLTPSLEAFVSLRKGFPDLEMVVRSDMSPEVKTRFAAVPGLTLLDQVVPWEVLAREFESADIFVLPTYSTPPFGLLDAMSYELPIVTLDAWANGEFVADGRTGLLVPPAADVRLELSNGQPSFGISQRADSSKVVADLVAKLDLLISNPELRRALGSEGRREVEFGKFSIAVRNETLGRIFDEALNSAEVLEGVPDEVPAARE